MNEVKTVNPIQIKTLTKRFANQITKVGGTWHERWAKLWTAIRDDHAEVKVLYWARGDFLDGMPDGLICWLVQENKDLYWLCVPDVHHPIVAERTRSLQLEQLFLS